MNCWSCMGGFQTKLFNKMRGRRLQNDIRIDRMETPGGGGQQPKKADILHHLIQNLRVCAGDWRSIYFSIGNSGRWNVIWIKLQGEQGKIGENFSLNWVFYRRKIFSKACIFKVAIKITVLLQRKIKVQNVQTTLYVQYIAKYVFIAFPLTC